MAALLKRLASAGGLVTLALGLTTAQAGTRVAAASPGVDPGILNHLTAVQAISPSDAWAVGYYCIAGCGGGKRGVNRTLIAQWNGTTWSQVPSPSPSQDSVLSSVSADAPGDAWAVGYYCSAHCATTTERDRALILHWNGTAWSRD